MQSEAQRRKLAWSLTPIGIWETHSFKKHVDPIRNEPKGHSGRQRGVAEGNSSRPTGSFHFPQPLRKKLDRKIKQM
jgi:hypothetical protein